MKTILHSLRAFSVMCLLVGGFASAQANDTPGSKDHPLVGRYEGAEIESYRQDEFNEAHLLKAPHDYGALFERRALNDRSGAEWLKLEGRVFKIRYLIPTGRSSLEVFRNHESGLKAKGFEVLFACADSACLTGNMRDPLQMGEMIDPAGDSGGSYYDHARYALFKRVQPQGAVYVALLAGEGFGITHAFAEVVETKEMQTDKLTQGKPVDALPRAEQVPLKKPEVDELEKPEIGIPKPVEEKPTPPVEEKPAAVEEKPAPIEEKAPVVKPAPPVEEKTPPTVDAKAKEPEPEPVKTSSADEMAAAISDTGNIAIYGILFDFDRAEIKPESKPQLEQIAALLKNDPALKVSVIGHTDNQGMATYNLVLSKRRAAAVVDVLIRDYGIAAGRMEAQGRGDTEPVSSNDSPEGQARNRRVELAGL